MGIIYDSLSHDIMNLISFIFYYNNIKYEDFNIFISMKVHVNYH